MALSRLVWIKYRCIRHGMAWGAAFFVLMSLGLGLGLGLVTGMAG